MIRAFLLLALFCLLIPAASAQSVRTDWREAVALYADRIVATNLTPGVSIAVAIGDRVEYVGGFGLADQEAGRRVTPETAFYIASTTKSLTAFATALLAAQGKIDLQAPISAYLPQLRLAAPLDPDLITVEDLLTLTHGIEDGGPVVARTAYTGEFTAELLIGLLADYAPSPTGRAFVYGNLGYNLLGLVLEAKLGTDWKEIVEQQVLVPLGMTTTSAYVSRFDPNSLALPHGVRPQGYDRIRLGKTDATLHAAGGHFATAGDLARYVAVHQSGGILDGKRVFESEPILATHQQHTDQDREFGPIHRFGWGYGWDLGTVDGDTLVHRFGSFAGYRSHVSFMPRHRIGVVVLVNGDGPASEAADLLAFHAYDLLLGKPGVDSTYSARLDDMVRNSAVGRDRFAQSLLVRAGRQAPLERPLTDFAGTYENPALGRMTFTVVGDRLEASMGDAQCVVEVFEAATNRLRVELLGGGSVVQFVFPDGPGPADAAVMNTAQFARVR